MAIRTHWVLAGMICLLGAGAAQAQETGPTPQERIGACIAGFKNAAAVQTTASGLRWLELGAGDAALPNPQLSDQVVVDYVGAFPDGRVFDDSYTRGEPAQFELGRLIKGWGEGLQRVRPGSDVCLAVPAALAYGAAGKGDIPPNAELLFRIQLLGVWRLFAPGETSAAEAPAAPR